MLAELAYTSHFLQIFLSLKTCAYQRMQLDLRKTSSFTFLFCPIILKYHASFSEKLREIPENFPKEVTFGCAKFWQVYMGSSVGTAWEKARKYGKCLYWISSIGSSKSILHFSPPCAVSWEMTMRDCTNRLPCPTVSGGLSQWKAPAEESGSFSFPLWHHPSTKGHSSCQVAFSLSGFREQFCPFGPRSANRYRTISYCSS